MSIESERQRLYRKWAGENPSLEQLVKDNDILAEENVRLTGFIETLLGKDLPHKVRLILTKNINGSNYQLMTATFAANQQQQFAFGLLDEVTNAPVTGSYADGTVASDTPGAATGFVDANGNVFFQAVAPGVANLTASAQATYTNSLGNQVVQQLSTAPVQVTIMAVQTADGVQLILTPGPITTLPVNPSV